jgi:4-hydroxy-tetrahydrodipicolinate reductase
VAEARVRIAVAGALGRMGRMILQAAGRDRQVAVVGGWERPGNPLAGQDLGVAAGLPSLGVALGIKPDLAQAAVVIDFTSPESTLALVKAAQAMRKAPGLVIGTTGLDPKQLALIKAAARRVPIVHSSNYSVGMNLLWQALALVASVTGEDYDVEVVEAHHHHKKDSPSGTAITTAEVLAKALGRDLAKWARYGRARGNTGPRGPLEIGLHAVRGGDIVGDHTVLFAGPGERLEFKHQAHSRENFAQGALRAAHWLAKPGRKPGLYTMAQVLGFER